MTRNKNKVRSDIATRTLYLLCKDTLPTPRAGNQEDPEELNIYEDELQSLTQETRDKLQTLTKIADAIDSWGRRDSGQGRHEPYHP